MNPSDRDATGLLTRPDEFVQLVTPAGERRADAEYDRWVADVDTAALGRLYRDMAIVRRLDAEATALQRQGELGLWPPLAGQEAAQIGSARALRDDDFVFSSYREHAVAWCRGVGPAELLTVWRGSASSGWDPFERRMAVPQIIIGAQALHATGYAMGAAWEGSDAATIGYFGDGATSEGDVNEAFVFAASFDAPVVFFCQNNQWAISEPVGLQSKQPLARRADGFGMPGIRVDGNDVLAVLAATRSALDRARRGEGPTLIEAVTYRLGPHTTADDPKRYRTDEELAEWRERDALARVLSLLAASGVDSDGFEREVADEAGRAAAELRAAVTGIPDPEPMSVFDHVYAEPNSHLERQRDHYARYLAMFDDAAASGAEGSAR
ncbi:MAG TPA: pyruvate dehydrogenase (acetyl-transferring) E1 component subunit alpha [Agromyces sp.]